jgi:hypothetical protein
MDSEKLSSAMGKILIHLLSIEYSMRELIKYRSEKTDEYRTLTYFGAVCNRYNELVDEGFRVDKSIIKLRNMFAHGMISFSKPDFESSCTILKYKKGTTTENQIDINDEWLNTQINITLDVFSMVSQSIPYDQSHF